MSETQSSHPVVPEHITVPEVLKPLSTTESSERRVLHFGQVIDIAAGDFKGDPSRVPGHPSNPATAIFTRR